MSYPRLACDVNMAEERELRHLLGEGGSPSVRSPNHRIWVASDVIDEVFVSELEALQN